jgi:competence ComEA-like helix-hairpin-helix protein
VAEARERAHANGVTVACTIADGEELPYPNVSFDAVWGCAVLHHLDLERAAKELVRVLAPGGVAVFCEPWGGNPFLTLARRFLPYPGKDRTADEQPLSRRDLEPLRSTFGNIEIGGYQLFSMARRVWRNRRVVRGLEIADDRILKWMPRAWNWCRYVVLLIALVSLLLLRGYGNRFGLRPTETATRPDLQLDLNTCERVDLEQLPSVGPKLAQAIHEHRKARGSFQSIEDLRDVHGIGPNTLDKIRPYLRVSPTPASEPAEPLVLTRKPSTLTLASEPSPRHSPVKIGPGEPRINENTATLEELQRLPLIGVVLAQRILVRREVAPFTSIEDLRKVKGIGAKTLDGLKPYVIVK